MARYRVLSETNNIDTNWSTFSTLLRDLEHRFIPTKTININGRRRNTFPIDKKTRELRDRPFSLKGGGGGGYGFLFRSEIFFSDNTSVRIFIFFVPEFNIRLYDKNSESDYFFFLHQNQKFFFQQHWESEYFFRKKP